MTISDLIDGMELVSATPTALHAWIKKIDNFLVRRVSGMEPRAITPR